jgi:hypothetical protein
MVNIELSAQQADELKNFYVSELEKILKRADVIRELLSKLDIEHAHIKLPETTQVKEQAPKEIITLAETGTKIPKWVDFIIQTFQEEQRPLSIKELLKLYEKQYKISKNSQSAMRQALFVMRTKTKQIKSISTTGTTEKLYSLSEWADKSVLNTKMGKPDTAIEPDKTTTSKFKYHWPQFIQETLNQQKRTLSLKEFVKYAMKHFEIPADKMKSIRGSIAPAISNLGKSNTIKSVQKKGFRGVSYGLAEWFDYNGDLVPFYK